MALRSRGYWATIATLQRDSVPTNLNQSNIQPVYDIYASVQGRDLGSIAADIGKIVGELQPELKAGNWISGAWADPEHARPPSGIWASDCCSQPCSSIC